MLILFFLQALLIPLHSQDSHNLAIAQRTFFCHTDEHAENTFNHYHKRLKWQNSPDTLEVGIQLEIDYFTFLDFDSNHQDLTNWAEEIIAASAAVYLIHGIRLRLDALNIHDSEDVFYTNNSLRQSIFLLAAEVQNKKMSDVILLLSTKILGGGKANISSLCQEIDPVLGSGPLGVLTGLAKSNASFPSYSWNTYLLAHELGHILGSRHTHACVWGLNNDQALDNCFGTEGGCNPGAAPSDGGTIMSYCNLTIHGINFNHGLGPEPAERIRSFIAQSSCISGSGSSGACVLGSPCDDGNECTIDDALDAVCNCVGKLLDINQNGICDLDEECPHQLDIHSIDQYPSVFLAGQVINLMTDITLPSLILSANGELNIYEGSAVMVGAEMTFYTIGCSSAK